MALSPISLARRWSEHLILGLVVEPSGADQIDGSQQPADLTAQAPGPSGSEAATPSGALRAIAPSARPRLSANLRPAPPSGNPSLPWLLPRSDAGWLPLLHDARADGTQ